MQLIHTKKELQTALKEARYKSLDTVIGLVPTMGALHRGHMQLVNEIKTKASITVVSIFVNPTQFLPGEDLDKYPRTLLDDCKKCEEAGVDFVFAPSAEEMYTELGLEYSFKIKSLNQFLCGASRPGHFEGVIQVVNKLFNIVEPDIAVFGQKDYQQFRIIEQMRDEFDHNIELMMAPIVREEDGLALSSRNRYLNELERQQAASFPKVLNELKSRLDGGTEQLYEDIEAAKRQLEESGLKVDYLSVVDQQALQPTERILQDVGYVLAAAVYCGKTRLIDNILIQ